MLHIATIVATLIFATQSFGTPFLMANPVYHNAPISSLNWTTDYQGALKQAAQENKTVLLFFTGSDWCTWCHKLEQEVLDTPKFAELAQDKFIFVKLDFPRKSQLSPQLKAQNARLQQKYAIKGYPTVILIDAQENLLANTGYEAGGPEKYAAHLDQLKPASLDTVAHYASLIKAGKMDEKTTIDLKARLLTSEHNRYPVAYAEFEFYSAEMERGRLSSEKATEPLVNYVHRFGSKDQEIWRVEATIAEAFSSQNQFAPALKWANAALEHSPAEVKETLQQMIAGIQSESQGDIAHN